MERAARWEPLFYTHMMIGRCRSRTQRHCFCVRRTKRCGAACITSPVSRGFARRRDRDRQPRVLPSSAGAREVLQSLRPDGSRSLDLPARLRAQWRTSPHSTSWLASQGATPALAFAVAQGVAKAPIRSVEEDLRAAYLSPPSGSKMDRIGRYLGEQVNRSVEEIEPLLRACERLPAGAKRST